MATGSLPGLQVVPGQAGGGSFKFETLIAYRAKQRLCQKVTGKPPVSRSNNLLTCQSDAKSFGCWILSHFIWSHRIAASLGNCSLHPSVSSQFISTHLMSSEFFHLISSHSIWCLLSLSQLFSADHTCSHLFSCHLSFYHLFSSQLISAFQIFTALLNSSQLSAAHVSSSYVFSSLLSFSHISSTLHTSTQQISALVSSSHLILALLSALSNHLTFSLAQNLLQNGSRRQSKQPLRFPQKRFDTEKLLHTASFCTQKLVHAEAFTQSWGSFYSQKAFTQSKLLYTASFCPDFCLHTEAFTQRSLYTEKLLHTASFDTKKLLHRKAFTHRKLLHSFYT